jgi:drug/metabolite transporter (DMT)-like permease
MKASYFKIDTYFYVYLFLITLFSICSQYLFKKIQKKELPYNYLIFGVLMYALLGFVIYKLLHYGNILILNIIWHLIYFILLFLMGYFIFQEKINFQKIVALILGCISLFIFMLYGID